MTDIISNPFDLSSGKREIGGGLERYTFQLPMSMLLLDQPNPRVLRQRLAGVYLLSPRPDFRDIESVSVKPDGRRAAVTLIIKRGHYQLAALVQQHEQLTFYRDLGYAECTCHPGTRHPLLPMSIPDYMEELCPIL